MQTNDLSCAFCCKFYISMSKLGKNGEIRRQGVSDSALKVVTSRPSFLSASSLNNHFLEQGDRESELQYAVQEKVI